MVSFNIEDTEDLEITVYDGEKGVTVKIFETIPLLFPEEQYVLLKVDQSLMIGVSKNTDEELKRLDYAIPIGFYVRIERNDFCHLSKIEADSFSSTLKIDFSDKEDTSQLGETFLVMVYDHAYKITRVDVVTSKMNLGDLCPVGLSVAHLIKQIKRTRRDVNKERT